MDSPNLDQLDSMDMLQLAQGEDHALNNLIHRHGDRLYRYLQRSLQNESEAADLAQETFVRVFLNRRQFDPSSRFVTWLYAIAGNLVRDRYRWRVRHPQTAFDPTDSSIEEALQNSSCNPHPSPEQWIQSQERSLAVQRAIAALPDEVREALLLSEYENLTHAEISVIVGCSPKAVEMRIYRARQILEKHLRKWMDHI